MNRSIKLGKLHTSRTELVDILKAWLVLSLAFAFVYSGISLLSGGVERIVSIPFLVMFVVSLFTAGLGFLLHELGHKVVAQKYGCAAEFRAWDQFLYMALGLAVLVGFIFAAPGAVMISGVITRKENGIISAIGPAINYVLAFIFLLLLKFVPGSPLLTMAFQVGFNINMWLGLFNLIPFGNLDGSKVFAWDPKVWGVMVAIGVYFVFFFV